MELNPNEEKILQLLRSGEFDQIVVDFRGKQMHSLSLIKKQDAKRKITEVLRENSFQEIHIKSHNGKVAAIKSTVKIKLKRT